MVPTFSAQRGTDESPATASDRWKMPITRATVLILREEGGPLHYLEITRRLVESDLIASSAARLERTVYSNLSKHIRKRAERSWFRHAGRGLYALTDHGLNAPVSRLLPPYHVSRSVPIAPQARGDLTWTDAAVLVLREEKRAMRPREILEKIWETGLKPRMDTLCPDRHMTNELARVLRFCSEHELPAPFERVGTGLYRIAEPDAG